MSDVMNLSEKTKVKVKVCTVISSFQSPSGPDARPTHYQHPTSGTEVEIDQEDLDFIEFVNELNQEAQDIYKKALGNA